MHDVVHTKDDKAYLCSRNLLSFHLKCNTKFLETRVPLFLVLCIVPSVLSSVAIISPRKTELIALLFALLLSCVGLGCVREYLPPQYALFYVLGVVERAVSLRVFY